MTIYIPTWPCRVYTWVPTGTSSNSWKPLRSRSGSRLGLLM